MYHVPYRKKELYLFNEKEIKRFAAIQNFLPHHPLSQELKRVLATRRTEKGRTVRAAFFMNGSVFLFRADDSFDRT